MTQTKDKLEILPAIEADSSSIRSLVGTDSPCDSNYCWVALDRSNIVERCPSCDRNPDCTLRPTCEAIHPPRDIIGLFCTEEKNTNKNTSFTLLGIFPKNDPRIFRRLLIGLREFGRMSSLKRIDIKDPNLSSVERQIAKAVGYSADDTIYWDFN